MTAHPSRGTPTALPASAIVLAAALLVASCATQATATPSGSPRPSPTGGPSATPSPDGSGAVEHPTGSDVVVLRLEEGGGFVPIDFLVTQAPVFSLYGDGTAIYRPVDTRMAAPFGGLNPLPFQRATLDDAQMDALLGFALGQGGLGEARESYENNTCADCLTTILTIRAAGLDKRVEVYALGSEAPDDPDRQIRVRFAQLAELLRSFETQVAAGKATDQGMYVPPAYRAILSEAQGVPGEVSDWPWQDVALADFVARPGDPFTDRRYGVLTHAQAKLLNVSPEGGVYPIAVKGTDGVTYTIGLRPLLPDEKE